jgi:hypothetical protein
LGDAEAFLISLDYRLTYVKRAGRTFPAGRFLVFISVKRLRRSQGHSAAENIMAIEGSIISTGIEPATFQLAALFFLLGFLFLVQYSLHLRIRPFTSFSPRVSLVQ